MNLAPRRCTVVLRTTVDTLVPFHNHPGNVRSWAFVAAPVLASSAQNRRPYSPTENNRRFPFLDPFWESRQPPNVCYRHPHSRKQPVRFPAQFGHSASVQTRTARIIQAALRNISRVIYGSNLMLNHMHTIIMNASNATVNQNKNVCSSRDNNHLSLTHNIVRLIYPVLNPFFIFITANIMPIIKISICSYSGRWI